MNILELNFERTWRGGERQTIYNMQGFLEAGHEVTLLCRKGFPLEKQARERNWKVVSFSDIGQVIRFLAGKGRAYDVMHAQTAHILTYCLLTKPFHGCRVLFSRRVDFVPRGIFTRLKYRRADKIFAVSTAVKKIVETFSGRKDVIVAPDIIVPEVPDACRAREFLLRTKIPEKRYLIGTVAALVPHKDPLNMLGAVKALKEKRDDFIFLHFGSGDLEDTLKQQIREQGLEQVYFPCGFVENVADFFAVFDVFVMSSREEGLGSSVLDAFIYKVPVVGTDAGGLDELLGEGRAIKCPKGSPEALAEGMDRLLSSPQEAIRKMTDTAYSYVLQKHSLEYITRLYLDALK